MNKSDCNDWNSNSLQSLHQRLHQVLSIVMHTKAHYDESLTLLVTQIRHHHRSHCNETLIAHSQNTYVNHGSDYWALLWESASVPECSIEEVSNHLSLFHMGK
jgi:hypothetical protein